MRERKVEGMKKRDDEKKTEREIEAEKEKKSE